MKKKNYSKRLAAVMLATTLLLVTGCGKADDKIAENTSVNQTDTTGVEEPTESETTENQSTSENVTTENPTTEATTTETDTTVEEETTTEIIVELKEIVAEDYVPLSSVTEDYTFTCEYTGEEGVYEYDQVTYNGQYPLSGGEDDEITVFVDRENSDASYIEINGVKQEIYIYTAILDVIIIDIDSTDSYKEVAILDDGPSADPNVMIYRYCDGKIYELGSYSSDGNYEFSNVLFDKKGKIISEPCHIDFLEELIVKHYFEVDENNQVTKVTVDNSAAMNKRYKLSRDITISFKETEEEDYDLMNLLHFKKGEEILLINIHSFYEYYVELPDGRRGYMTTHVAG